MHMSTHDTTETVAAPSCCSTSNATPAAAANGRQMLLDTSADECGSAIDAAPEKNSAPAA